MAGILYDKTAFGMTAHSRSITKPSKANIDVFPEQLVMQCGAFEIHAGPSPADTKILIHGKEAKGIYSLKLYLNSQRSTKIELGVFVDDFDFNNLDERPRR
jgi:hypothetical protein